MTASVSPPEQAPGDGLREASKKCSKPGCGALRLVGQPCTDWDCPQQWISAAEHRQVLARVTAERDEARAGASEMWEDLKAEGEARHVAAENVRLREALERIAEEHDAGRHDGLPEPCPAHDAEVMWAVARAVLAEPRHDR